MNLQEVVAQYGARIGTLEPMLRRVQAQEPKIAELLEELRSLKLYDQSDKLREILNQIRSATSYAFPKGPKT